MQGATTSHCLKKSLCLISIHAPMQGATLSSLPTIISLCISIHAPMQGATGQLGGVSTFSSYFNPRTHAGCDTTISTGHVKEIHFNPRTHAGCDIFGDDYLKDILISIHAPMQGATDIYNGYISSKTFQSTHPCRVRPSTLGSVAGGLIIFQSTHPCRVRLLDQQEMLHI